jgi:hypothetical protein
VASAVTERRSLPTACLHQAPQQHPRPVQLDLWPLLLSLWAHWPCQVSKSTQCHDTPIYTGNTRPHGFLNASGCFCSSLTFLCSVHEQCSALQASLGSHCTSVLAHHYPQDGWDSTNQGHTAPTVQQEPSCSPYPTKHAAAWCVACAHAGAANGKITLAQADSAVAMAQTEKVDRLAPISRTAWQN